MLSHFCTTPRELDIAFAILLLALVTVALGKGAGQLLVQVLKKTLGRAEISVNVGGGEPKAPAKNGGGKCRFDPKDCAAHQAEFERSKRNEAEIEAVKSDLKDTRKSLFGRLDSIDRGIADLRVEVAELHPAKMGKG